MITDLQKKIVRALQEGLPLVSRPYLAIAEKVGISEEELIGAIKEMRSRGLIRRFGAAVRHQDLGYTANAMIVWKVPAGEVDRVGGIFSNYPEVSHCYERSSQGAWQYNLFTMVHGKTPLQCREIAGEMSKISGISEYQVLFSTGELKKESMKYFI
jgi:DNA-binding Lrp family transcriptional regulator